MVNQTPTMHIQLVSVLSLGLHQDDYISYLLVVVFEFSLLDSCHLTSNSISAGIQWIRSASVKTCFSSVHVIFCSSLANMFRNIICRSLLDGSRLHMLHVVYPMFLKCSQIKWIATRWVPCCFSEGHSILLDIQNIVNNVNNTDYQAIKTSQGRNTEYCCI